MMFLDNIDSAAEFFFNFLPTLCLLAGYTVVKTDFTVILACQITYSLTIKALAYSNRILNNLVYKHYNQAKIHQFGDLKSVLKQKKVFCLITGGSQGLGEALSIELVKKYGNENNFNLIIVDREPLAHERLQNSSIVKFVQFDFENNTEELKERLPQELKKPDGSYKILINNCGTRHRFDTLTKIWSEKVFAKVFQINVIAAANMIQILNPDYLVTVSSVLSQVTPQNASIYCASKAALSSIHEAFVHTRNKKGLLVLPGQLKDTSLFANIKNDHTFLAPLVDINKLSAKVVSRVAELHNGTIIEPLYGHFIQILGKLPYWLQAMLREASGLDHVTETSVAHDF